MLFIDKQQEVIAQKANLTIDKFINEKIIILEQAADINNLSDVNGHRKEAVLYKLHGKELSFRQLFIFDTNGIQFSKISRLSKYSYNGTLNNIPDDILAGFKEDTTFISDVFIDEKTFEPMVIISVPVRNVFGDFKGSLFAVTNLNFMWNLMDTMEIGGNGLAYIVDRTGRLIAFKDVSRVLKGENLGHLEQVKEIVNGYDLKKSKISRITKGILGTYVVSSHINLGLPDWEIVIEIPVKEAYLPVIRAMIGSLITIFVCIAVAIMSSVYLSGKIIRPLILLRDAAKKVGQGDLSVKVRADSSNEFGELACSFNSMVKEISNSTTSIENLTREIMERKNAEEKLRESEEKFRTLSTSLPIGVMLFKPDGSILFSNTQWDILFGFTTTNWDGWDRFVTPEYLPMVKDAWMKLFTRNGVFSEEFSIRNLDNKHIWLNVKALSLFSDIGPKIIVIAEDISNRKKAQLESEQTRIQLIQSEKMAGIGQLAAGIAHEINNPVGFVLGNSETMVDYFKSIKAMFEYYDTVIDNNVINEKKKKLDIEYILNDLGSLLNDNNKGLQRIVAIVTNLKNFARIEQSNEIAEADLEENIDNTIIIAKNEIKYHADIKTDYGHVGTALCNIGEINQVFLNILINAAQAFQGQNQTKRGLITVKTWKQEEDDAFISISDDGPGIDEKHIRKIFDPFFTTKPVGKGTGLGLNIAWDIIVNRHKGDIKVESILGKGTCFTIRIPKGNVCVES